MEEQTISYRNETESSALAAAYRKTAARILPVLLLAYIVGYLDRVNIAFAKLQILKHLQLRKSNVDAIEITDDISQQQNRKDARSRLAVGCGQSAALSFVSITDRLLFHRCRTLTGEWRSPVRR